MTQYVALIRHGDYAQRAAAPSAFQPFPLTPLGEEQAMAAVAALREFAEATAVAIASPIHCSCLLRAWQTADIIARRLHTQLPQSFEVRASVALAERCVGSLANLTTTEIEQVMAADPRFDAPPAGWKSNSHYCLPYPGAESLMQAGERVADYLRQSVAARPQSGDGAPVSQLQVFVGHGAAFRHAAHCLGVIPFDDIAKLSMHHAQPVFLAHTEAAGWRQVAGAWKQRKPKEAFTD